ncbi:MAG: hypothetical protein CVU52_06980 [Deltaproteobacteria bacterium HGW-Deltaproteobacteria-10]|nr:MAG: hypothetical protein CVU52_06980 [Deltaproteobacteria bacterium HGW-Deltaproteobacteria-10]
MKPVVEGLNAVSAMVEGIGGSFDAEKDILYAIRANLALIRDPLVDFERVVRNLNILGILIKIERAGLGDAGMAFDTLAEEVRRIAALIGTKTGSLIDKTDTLIPALNNNIALIDNYKSQQEGQSRLVLDKISKDMALISQRKELSATVILGIAEQWRQTTASIGAIVQSMQFHDITRQRIEHSSDALKNLQPRITDWKKGRAIRHSLYNLFKRNGGNNGSGGFTAANLVADTCDLQRAQLQNAKNDFASAIERILDNMKNVAFYAGTISEEIMKISGKQEGKEGAFLRQLEQDVDNLSNSIGTFALIKKDLSAAMNTLTQTAADMSAYMKEMEKIGIEMQILALNASIHAAHIGDQGVALGTLADSIHTLAAETAAMVIKIVTNLHEAILNAEKLAAMADAENAESNRITEQIKNSLGQMLLPLKAIDVEIEELLPKIDNSGNALAADIQDLINSVTIHHKVTSGIERVETALEKALQILNVKSAKKMVSTESRLLKDLAAQYTMQSERDTLLAAAGIVTAQLPTEPPLLKGGGLPPAEIKAASGKGDDLGDNVELF